MGSYLAKPVTEKESIDENNSYIAYGASSMQGWRTFQEDAHNAILDFDKNLSFFAVYDGHGGDEVAVYTAKHFPDHLKEKLKESEDYSKTLADSFLEFDSKLIQPDILEEIQTSAQSRVIDTESYEEELVDLYEEAHMPIEKLLQKYRQRMRKPRESSDDDISPKPGGSGIIIHEKDDDENSSLIKQSTEESACSSKADKQEEPDSPQKENNSTASSSEEEKIHNGEICGSSRVESEVIDTKDSIVNGENSSGDSNGEVKTGKGTGHSKGKNVLSAQEVEDMKKSQRSKLHRAVEQTASYQKMHDCEEEFWDDDDSEDDSDSDVQMDEQLGEEECSDEVDEEESSNEEEEDEETEGEMEPCYDSGCTACVAVLRERMLYVANVGDSRCVIYRNRKAVDMSIDHKPEDSTEFSRITKAGGEISDDGRVNGGLNLSRALGDHRYKQNKTLKAEEQMISAEPDLRCIQITDKDDFMMIACDGIWNSLSSQEACDFVDKHLQEKCKLSTICEKLFDLCLAPNSSGDGTGCDNMTCIIVQFNFANEAKRKPIDSCEESEDGIGNSAKRHKQSPTSDE